MSTSPWRIRLFGGFRLERSDVIVVSFGGRLDEQLLAYVSLLAPTAVARRTIVSLLWPDVEVSTALKNLSVTLFALKKLLRDAGLDDEVIESVRTSLRLSSAVSVDVQAFLEALARSTKAVTESDRVRYLESAVSMYGSGLVPDLDIEWLDRYRRQFARLYRYAIDALANPDRQMELMSNLREDLPSIAWNLSSEPSLTSTKADSAAASQVIEPELLSFTKTAGAGLASTDWVQWAEAIDERRTQITRIAMQAIREDRLGEAAGLLLPIWRYWQIRGLTSVGFALFEALLRAGFDPVDQERGQFFHAIGTLATYSGRFGEARDFLQQALEQWRALDLLKEEIRTRANLGISYFQECDFARAMEVYEDCLSLARAVGDTDLQIQLTMDIARAAIRTRNADKATSALQRRAALLEPLRSERPSEVAATWSHLAAVSMLSNDYSTALRLTQAAVSLSRESDDRIGLINGEQLLGRIAYHQGQLEQAQAHMSAAVALAREAQSRWDLGVSLSFLAIVLRAQGQDDQSEEVMADAERLLKGGSDAGALARAQVEIALLQHQGAQIAPPGHGVPAPSKRDLIEGKRQT